MKEIGREIGIPGGSGMELGSEGPMTRKQFELAVTLLGEKRALELAEIHGVEDAVE